MPADRITGLTVGVLGGSGAQGRGLARRFAAAGLGVVLGSRSVERGVAAAAAISAPGSARDTSGGTVTGADNAGAAAAADLVVVAVPWAGHRTVLEDLAPLLAGKVVVDCVNPLGFDQRGAFALDVPEGSAAEQAAKMLPGSTVVAAFHHVSAALLDDPELGSVDTDVLVLGDDRAATDLVQALAETIPGVRGVFGGRLRDAHQVEALTANLITVNRRYRTHAGVRVTYR